MNSPSQTFSLPITWLILIVSCVACIVPDIVLQIVMTIVEKQRNADVVSRRAAWEDKQSFSSSTPLMKAKRNNNFNGKDRLGGGAGGGGGGGGGGVEMMEMK